MIFYLKKRFFSGHFKNVYTRKNFPGINCKHFNRAKSICEPVNFPGNSPVQPLLGAKSIKLWPQHRTWLSFHSLDRTPWITTDPFKLLHAVHDCRFTHWIGLLEFKPGTYNKRNNRVPSWKKAPVCQTCTKHMRGVAKMLEYKQKRNNGRTPFAGVYKFVCVGGGGGGVGQSHGLQPSQRPI